MCSADRTDAYAQVATAMTSTDSVHPSAATDRVVKAEEAAVAAEDLADSK